MAQCNSCPETDPSKFYESSPKKCKACVLKRQKALKDAKTTGKKKAKAKAKAKTASKQPATRGRAAADTAATAQYQRPPGMGFAVRKEVDESTGVTDVRIDQHNSTAAADWSIWLNPLEASELRDWLNKHHPKS